MVADDPEMLGSINCSVKVCVRSRNVTAPLTPFTFIAVIASLIVVYVCPAPTVYEPESGVKAAALYWLAPRLGEVVRAVPSISTGTTENKFLPAEAVPGADAYRLVFD